MKAGITATDLKLLYKYASKCKFIIETGAGESTKYLSKAALKKNAIVISIERYEKRCKPRKRVKYRIGWSINHEDIILPSKIESKKEFLRMDKKYRNIKYKKKIRKKMRDSVKEIFIAYGHKRLMKGEKDLIRKTIKEYKDKKLDFFFCDSGAYCGFAEWNIVKHEIAEGGYFAIHDIYYPKSIKGFLVAKEIERSKEWKILEKTNTAQGLLIAQKIK